MKVKKDLKYINSSGPLFFMFDITYACNFKCLHCYNNSGCKNSDELTNEEIIDIAHQIAEVHPESVCLCGGEPMTRKNIFDIVKVLSPNVGAVNMVSNGSLLNKDNIRELKRSGISSIQISVDGINSMQHDTFRGYVGAFDKAINAIKMISEQGIDVMVSCIPNKMNYKSLPELFTMMHSLGVSSVRFMPLIPIGRGSAIDPLLLNSNEYAELQYYIDMYKPEYANIGMMIEWGDPLDHMYRLSNNEVMGYKNFQAHIKANGDLAVSAYLPFICGNLRKHSLKEYWKAGYDRIWYHPQYQKYRDMIESIYDINTISDIISKDGCCIDIMNDMKEEIKK